MHLKWDQAWLIDPAYHRRLIGKTPVCVLPPDLHSLPSTLLGQSTIPVDCRHLPGPLESREVRWVRRFLKRPATDEPLADRVRKFCEELEPGGSADWQVRQAEQALKIYFRQFLGRPDWLEPAAAKCKRGPDGVEPLGAVEQLRRRVKTRH